MCVCLYFFDIVRSPSLLLFFRYSNEYTFETIRKFECVNKFFFPKLYLISLNKKKDLQIIEWQHLSYKTIDITIFVCECDKQLISNVSLISLCSFHSANVSNIERFRIRIGADSKPMTFRWGTETDRQRKRERNSQRDRQSHGLGDCERARDIFDSF